MPLIGYYKLVVFERYLKFDGRAARPEFWWFVLANLIIGLVLQGIAVSLQSADNDLWQLFSFAYVVYFAAIILPYIAVLIRRLHDTGKSGYFAFWLLLPLIGSIILIVLTVQPGDDAENEYGAVPAGLPG
ncbi:MAG: DUF805 domain-containing protein [Acidimicrobiia bacterium]|nr:DUF805 domain-containing protein [Acidimicrobiia bacterium]